MNNASLELGGTNWAEKDGNILGYSVGDTSGKYSPQEFTFARGSNLSATRIDRAGLIVKGRENVLLQSNSLDTSPWVKLDGATLVSGQSGYDGSLDAWRINITNLSNSGLYQAIPLNGVYSYSIYAKAGDINYLGFTNFAGSNYDIFFNLSNGTIANQSGFIDATITSAGNGFYRCTLTSVNPVYLQMKPSSTASNTSTAGYIFMQDLQVELGLAASPYIETTTTSAQAGVLENTPRLNYTTGVANPYLLLEPSRTNLIAQSEYFGDSYWTKDGASVVGGFTSPEGLSNAFKLTEDSSNAVHLLQRGFTVSSGSSYTYKIFVKMNGRKKIMLRESGSTGYYVAFDLLNNTIIDQSNAIGTINNIGNDWVELTHTSVSGNSFNIAYFILPDNYVSGQPQTYQGDGTSGFYIYGAQLEEGSYPTSYIPTYSVSATRAQDVCNKTNASGEIGQTEGTMFVDLSNVQNLDFPEITIDNNSNTDRIVLTRDATGNWGIFVASSVTTPSSNVVYSAVGGTSGKFAIAYSSIGYVLYRNGVQISTLTYGLPSALSVFRLNGRSTNDYNSIKNINQAQLYTTRLTNAELATLTTI